MKVSAALPFLAIALAVAAVPFPVRGQSMTTPTTAPATKSTAADVPVKKVALFSSGVGYFEHAGVVRGDAETSLSFKTDQVNDVLKSLILADLDGGSVSSVSYQSQDPLGKTLAGFQIDLSGEPAVWQILAHLRGAEVVVTTSGNRHVGKILGVEPRKKAVGDKAVIDVSTLNLVTANGIVSVSIDEASSIVLTDPKLQEEMNKALAAVAGARDADKKQVTVHFDGDGERKVRIGYVVETPVWKTSYRLSIGDDKSSLQGWAIVENQSDADWSDVSLSLVSGRPMSFRMDLYEPMYLPRPEAKLELFAGLTPQTYAESRDADDLKEMESAAVPGQAMRKASRARGGGGGGAGLFSGGVAPAAAPMPMEMAAADMASSSNAAVTSRATSGSIGELFEYAIPNVTIARQSSAMVPIVSEPIEVEPISIFNSNVLQRYPLSGARVKNTTGKNLLQGPITVFQGGGYAGDAQVNNVPPGQSRLISFGVDLQTIVDADKQDQSSDMVGIKIVNGTVISTHRTTQARHYQITNKSPKKKTVVVEHRNMGQAWTLVETAKPTETTDQLYRFDRALEAGKGEDFVVTQQTTNGQSLAILDADWNGLVWYTRHGVTPPKVREAIEKAIALKQQQADLDRQIGERKQEVAEIATEQTRIRENMKTVDKASAYYARLMKKLDEQENTIEKARTAIDDLTGQRDAKRKELEAYLNGLNVG